MIKIIEGKRYSTESAEEIASFASTEDITSFKHFEERLYRTEKGSWFLHGKGWGPYAKSVDSGRSRGESIIPKTQEEARKWLEKRDLIDALEKHFADDIEDA